MAKRWSVFFISLVSLSRLPCGGRAAAFLNAKVMAAVIPKQRMTEASRPVRARVQEHDSHPHPLNNKDSSVQELSDIDSRVLNELLDDPSIMESLREEGARLISKFNSETGDPAAEGSINTNALSQRGQREIEGAIESVGASISNLGQPSDYESATMQVVEGLQNSMRGVFAKVSAALESAGILASNRAQADSKVIAAFVEYAKRKALEQTGQLLLAARPALQLMGVNATQTGVALNDSIQLISLGIVPNLPSAKSQFLPSLKHFGDDDKRIEAAYQRQRRTRSKPLPLKVLGALPSSLNKAADLGYEVDQEVKYERAGRRVNKLLRPIGIALPESKDRNYLLGASSKKKLISKSSEKISKMNKSPSSAIEDNEIATQDFSGPEVSPREISSPRECINEEEFTDKKGHLSSGIFTSEAGATDRQLAIELSQTPPLLLQGLRKCIQAIMETAGEEDRRIRAAEAVICSTETLCAVLQVHMEKELSVHQQLTKLTRDVQQTMVLREMTEAVEAGKEHLRSLRAMEANVTELAARLRAYIELALKRRSSFDGMAARLKDLEEVVERDVKGRECVDLRLADDLVAEMHAVDNNIDSWRSSLHDVEDSLQKVWQESFNGRFGGDNDVHGEAFDAAARLWKAAAYVDTTDHFKILERVKSDMLAQQSDGISMTPKDMQPSNATLSNRERRTGEGVDDRGEVKFPSSSETSYHMSSRRFVASPNGNERVSESCLHVSQVPPDDELPRDALTSPRKRSHYASDKTATRGLVEKYANDQTVVDATLSAEGEAQTLISNSWLERGARDDHQRSNRQIGSPIEIDLFRANETAVEVVVETTETVVDVEANSEDDTSEPTIVLLKALDVLALLLEKVLFVALPSVLSSGSLVYSRIDNALYGARGRKGWKVLNRIKSE